MDAFRKPLLADAAATELQPPLKNFGSGSSDALLHELSSEPSSPQGSGANWAQHLRSEGHTPTRRAIAIASDVLLQRVRSDRMRRTEGLEAFFDATRVQLRDLYVRTRERGACTLGCCLHDLLHA